MNIKTLVVESFEIIFQGLAGPGNLMRNITNTGPEPWATIGVSMFFLLPLAAAMTFEWYARRVTGRKVVAVPDYMLVAEPDVGINTWALFAFWAIIQGPISAVI